MQTPCHITVDPDGYDLTVTITAPPGTLVLTKVNGSATTDSASSSESVRTNPEHDGDPVGPRTFWFTDGGIDVTVAMTVESGQTAATQVITLPLAGGKSVVPILAASGGSGTSSALPTPNLAVGRQGKFGIVSWDGVTIPSGTTFQMPASAAYTLDSADSQTTAVDNAYMAWDPGGDPSVITIKQAGWYLQVVGMNFDTSLTQTLSFGIDAISGSNTGNNVVDIEVAAGGNNNYGAGWGVPGWLAAGTQLCLRVHAGNLTSDVVGAYGELLFCPMFELA